MDAPDSKRALLAATFRKMPLEELQRRVASRRLVPVAQELAELELKNRQERPAPSPALPEGAFFFADSRRDAVAVAAVTAAALGVAWWLLSPGLFGLAVLAVGPAILATLGKLFPRIGTVLGLLAVATPFALGFWMWRHGEMSAKGGDFQALGPLFAWIGLFVVTLLSWAVAGGLLTGARHRGSWLDFNRTLQKQTDEAIGTITERKAR